MFSYRRVSVCEHVSLRLLQAHNETYVDKVKPPINIKIIVLVSEKH